MMSLNNHFPEGPLLNVGSGPVVASEWINIDGSLQAWLAGRPWLSKAVTRIVGRDVGGWPQGIVCRDVRRGISYQSDTVAAVYSSHTLEHFYRDEALRFLQEARRVLRPAGICRIVVPDVASIIRWYHEHSDLETDKKELPSSDLLMKMLLVQPCERPRSRGLLGLYRQLTSFHDHKWMYDSEGLLWLFREAGFRDACVCEYLESAIPTPLLSKVEYSNRLTDGTGICVEARK